MIEVLCNQRQKEKCPFKEVHLKFPSGIQYKYETEVILSHMVI